MLDVRNSPLIVLLENWMDVTHSRIYQISNSRAGIAIEATLSMYVNSCG